METMTDAAGRGAGGGGVAHAGEGRFFGMKRGTRSGWILRLGRRAAGAGTTDAANACEGEGGGGGSAGKANAAGEGDCRGVEMIGWRLGFSSGRGRGAGAGGGDGGGTGERDSNPACDSSSLIALSSGVSTTISSGPTSISYESFLSRCSSASQTGAATISRAYDPSRSETHQLLSP